MVAIRNSAFDIISFSKMLKSDLFMLCTFVLLYTYMFVYKQYSILLSLMAFR